MKNIDFINNIEKAVIEENIDLVVFDNFSCFNSYGKDENSNTLIRSSLNQISPVQQSYKIPMIMIHHSAKNNPTKDKAVRGAAAFSNWATEILWIKKTSPIDYSVVELKSRNELVNEDGIKFKYEGKRIYSVSATSTSNQPTKITEIDILVEAMNELGGTCANQESLKKFLSSKFKAYKWNKSSLSYCKEVIDNALDKNIITFDSGKNNSMIFKLNSNSK